MQRPLSQRGLFGLGDSIRIEALDRDAGRFGCQLEQLEPKKVLAVDVDLSGTVLTVSFDDAADDAVSLAITPTGYESTGANVSSATGTITQLVVTDAGTAKTSSFSLTNASQDLTGGISIGSQVTQAAISSDVTTAGGNVTIDSSTLTLAANINSGDASQTYGGAVVLADDVTLLTNTGVAGDIQIEFQGTVDSDSTPRTLDVKSEAIYARGAFGGTSALASYGGQTLGDPAERGQFYRSVTTVGTQIYQAETNSGDIEFNGTYTTTDSDIDLIGIGAFGVYLSLVGDTSIDIGTGTFAVQRVGSSGGGIFSDGGPFNLSIDAGRVSAPRGIGNDPTGNLATPEINVLSLLSGGATKVYAAELVATGGIQAFGQVQPQRDISFVSGSGEINLAGGISNDSLSLTLGDANQTGSIFVGSTLHMRDLHVGAGAFDLEFNGSLAIVQNFSAPTKFLNTGNLTLYGQGSSFFGGIEALGVANTFVAGCVATYGEDISLNNVTMLDSPYANRFDSRGTQQTPPVSGGANISISNFTSSTSRSVNFDIGDGTPNVVTLSGTTTSTNDLDFKGNGSVEVTGDASLSGSFRAQNLAHLDNTTPSLAFSGNVTLTGAMAFEGITASFANGVEGGGNDLTLDFLQAASVDGLANIANFTSLGGVELNGTFATTGFQKYAGPVSLLGDTVLTGTVGSFAAGLNGATYDVVLNFSGLSMIDGGFENVNDLTVTGPASLNGAITTSEYEETSLAYSQNFNGFANGTNGTGLGDGSNIVSTTGVASVQTPPSGYTALRLTEDGIISTVANWFLPDLNPGKPIESFSADFDSMIYNAGGTAADAWAFNFGNITDTTSAYLGAGSGLQSPGNATDVLTVSFTTYTTNQIQVWYNGSQIGGSIGVPIVTTTSDLGNFVDTQISWTAANGLSVVYNGVSLTTNLAIPGFDPGPGYTFAFNAWTGLDQQSVWLDNVNITTGVMTGGNQTYEGNVTLAGDTTLTGTAGVFNAAVAGGNNDLTLNFAAETTIDGSQTFANIANLTSLGDVSLDGTIQTSGAQNYAANATLIGATTVEAGADVSFGGLVDGAEGLGGLSVNSSGTTTFGGAVGSVVPLTSLTTDANGSTVLGGNVTTTGDQTFGDQVNLTTDTTLIAGAGAINASAGVSGAGQNLTVGDANQTGAVTLGGGVTLGSLTTGAGDFDVTVTALNPDKTTVTGVSEFLNNGTVSLLADGQFQSFEGGLNASAAQVVRVAGGVATTNAPLSLNNVTAVDTIAKISTTGGQDVGSNGSTLTINGLELNGATVTTYGGTTGETVLTGAVNLSAGTLSVAAGDLALGSGGTGATLTATDTETVAVAANYEISLAAFTTLSAAGQTVNFKADDFLISSAPDSLTAGCLTFSTATAGTNFALGANKGTKGDVVLSQAAFDSFNASRVEIGQSGSSGNINMGALTLDGPRLDLWANGGGSVAISGAYDGTTSESVSLYVHGSDNGTEIAANITSNSAVVIADSVEITADVTIDTTSGNASITLLGGMPGGTAAGIYADSGFPSGRELVILAGTGTVYLGGDDANGNLAGFTDNGGSAAPVNTVDITAGETRLYGTSNEFEFDWYINGPMTLANPNNVDILITGGSFIMNGTIDSAANTTNSLTLEVYGNSDLEGAVGDTVPLGNLTDQGTTSVLSLYENITTLGDQTWKREVQLAGDVTFTGNAGSFLGGLNAASNDLVLNFSNLVTIDGSSTFANVGNLTSVGPAAVKGTIATSGSQTYSGNVSLIGATTLQGTGAVLSGAIAGGNNPLTLKFYVVTVLDGGIANVQTLTALTDVDLAGAIQTSGDQNYAANVTLIGSTSLEGNAATFATGVSGGGNDLSINFTQASLDGLSNINNFTSLGGVELNGTFTTTGFQNYAGPIALLGDTSLNPTQLLIGGSVTGNNHNLTLSQTAGPITLSDAEISGVNLLDIVSDANLSGNLGAVEVTMQGNVALTGDTVATASGQVRFFKTIDGPHSLTTNASAAVFNGLVGSDSPLANFGVLGDAYLYNNITVTGEQDFDGNVTLQSDVTLSSNKTLITQGLNIDGAEGNRNLTIDADETAVVIANVSGIAALSINSRNITLGGVIETTGNQTYNATDEFGFDATLLSGGGDIVLGSESSQPKFAGFSNSLEIGDENQTGDVQIYANGTVDSLVVGNGSFDISIDTNADLTFNDKVDFLNNGSVSIATGAAESSCVSFTGGLNATAVSQVNLFGTVRTAGNAINLSTLVLNNGGGYPYALGVLDTTNDGSDPPAAPITIESLNVSGGGFGFETGVNNVLTLTGSSDLNGLIVIGDGGIEATGDVVLGGSIQIAGDQNYSANVTLGRATTLTGNTATFVNALEGAGNDLTINFTQTSTVDGFNNIHNFTSLSAVELNGSFSTTGAQNYAGPVTLVGDTTLVDQASSQFAFDYENMSVNGTVAGIGDTDAVATSPDGRYAFVTAGSEGLKVIDISNPANGSVVACVSTTTPARDVVLSANGTYAFVTTQSKLEILDVSNVSGPSSVGNVTMKNAGGISLSADGKYVFVADGNLGGLKIVDVSNVASPIIKGSILTGGSFARDVVVSLDGKYAYVAAQAGGLQIFDVSNVSLPKSLGNLSTSNLAVGVTLARDSNYVFVAAKESGLLTVDVSNVSSPRVFESFSTTGAADSSILSADGNYLYVTSVGGLRVVNLTDIGNQTTAGTLSFFGPRGLSLADDGEFVYVADRTNGLKSVQLGTYTPEAGLIRFGSEVSGNHTLTVGDANTTGEVEFGGNTAIASLVSAPGNFNVSLTGTNNTLGAANFQHTGVLGIGNDETDRTFVPGGITAPNVALSQLGGTFATNGSAITFNDISLLANATLDSTNNNLAPAGANVLISGGLTLNSYTLVTKTGTAATEVEGDVTIQNGTVKVEQGSLDIGVGNTSANVTFVQNTTITVAAGGQLNVGNGSSLTAGNNTLTLTTDVLNVSPTAGNITGSAVTITPVTPGNSIHAGNATGPGLLLPQSTINKMQTPVLTLGGTGYNGTIEVQGLTGSFGRLNLIANGTGGAIDLSGGLNLSGKGDDGVSLFIQGSGATTNLSGNVNLAGAAKIYDAVQLVGDASIVSTGGNVTITGGNTGIYSQLGNSYNLSIDAGIVVLGNQTGFGDNSGSDSFVGDLTVNATSTTFGNATQQIDGTLTVTGTSLSLENTVETGGAINIAVSGTTTIVNDLTLNATGGGINILGSIAGPGSLNVTAAGNVALGGTAGDTGSELAALTVFSANGAIAAAGAATTGSQQFALGNQSQSVSIRGSYATDNSSLSFNVGNAAVLATGNVLLSTGSGNISVSGDLLATVLGSESLTVNSTGVATFGGAVGNVSSSASSFFNLFTTDAGGTTQFAGNVVSLGIVFNSDVELLGNVTFAGLVGAFDGSVDGGGFGVQLGFLETAVDGARWSNLASLRFESGTIGLSNTITTTGLQEYNGRVVLSDNTTLVAGADGLSLLGAVDGSTSGNQSLVINTTGVTNLAGNIGAITPLASLTTSAGGNTTIAGPSVITTGNQSYGDAVVLSGDVELRGQAGQFAAGVEGGGNDLTLNFAAAALNGNFVNITDLTSEGNVTLSGTILTSGSQTYNGSAALAGNTSLTGTSLSLASGVEGAGKSLDLNFASTTALDGTFTNITDLTSEGNVTLNGTIATSGSQTYNGSAALTGNASLTGATLSLASGVEGAGKSLDLNFTSTTALDGGFANITDLTSEGNVTLSGSISTSGSQTYNGSAALAGNASLTGTSLSLASGVEGAGKSLDLNFTSTTALDGNFVNITDLTSEGNVTLSGTISTSGSQTYNGSAALAGNTSLTGTTLSLASGVEGAGKSLDLNFTSTTALDGNFVNITDLTSEGNVTLSGTISTSGSQTYNGSAALAGNTSLTGSSLSVASGVEGAGKSLDLNFTSTTALDGNFVNITDLTSEGNVTLSGTILTSGSQTYNGTAALKGNASLTGTVGTFASGVTGNNESLSFNFTGGTTDLSGISNVSTFTADSDVSVAGNFTTNLDQYYNANVTLAGDTTLAGNSARFVNGVIGGGNGLTLNFTSTTALEGSFANLADFTSVGDVSINGTIATAGDQNYQANASLAGDTTLTATSPGTNVALPTLAGTLVTSGRALGVTLSSDGQYAYVADSSGGLQIIDVTNVASPTLAGSYNTPATAYEVALSSDGRYAYVADSVAGLQIINVTNVNSPELAGSYDTSGRALGVTLSSDGQYAFVADNYDGLQVIDVSNVAAPTLAGNLDTSGEGQGVTLSSDGQYAYVADGFFGLQIINVTNVTLPTLAGSYDTSGFAFGVTLSSDGQYAYVADGARGLQIINVTNVASPVLAGTLETSGFANFVALSSDGQYAYVADENSGLQIIDVTNVASPTLAGTFNTSGSALGVAVSSNGQYAYVADDNSGLQIITGTAIPATIAFGGTLDGCHSLTANASAVNFAGPVGSTTKLASLTTTANTTAILGGSTIETTGNQAYGGAVNLAGDTTLAGNAVSFANGVIGGGNGLTLNFAVTTAVDGNFVNITDLTSEGNVTLSGTVATSGSQTYNGTAALNGDTSLAGTSLSLANGVAGNAKSLALNFSSTTALDGSFSNLTNLTSEGDVTLNGTITTLGSQTYNGTAALNGDTSLAGTSLGLASGVAGNTKSLALSFSQTTELDGSLSNLTNLTSEGDVTLNGTITTLGSQTYNGSAALNGDTSLAGTSLSLASGVAGNTKSLSLNFSSTTALDGSFSNLTNLSSEGDVTLNGTITTLGSQTYNSTAALNGDANLAGTSIGLASGITGNAKSLALNFTSTTTLDGSFSNLTNLSSEGDVTLSGAISTSGSQTYNGTAALTGNTSLTGTSVSLFSGITGNAKSLALSFSQTTDLDGSFSNLTNLSSEGPVTLNGTITTLGSQTYNGAAALNGSTSLAGKSLSLASGVAGNAKSLALNFSQTTDLDGSFSNLTNLTSEGDVTLNGTITTSGSQTYNGSAALNGDTSLAGTSLSLASGVAGNAKSLALNFSQTTDLDGSFSNLTNLTSEGDVTLNGTITTSGSQTYNGSAALNGDTSLAGTSLSLASGVAGNTKSLALNFSSTTALDGSFSNLTNLSSEGDVTLNGTITTLGSQTYNGTAALAGNTSLAGTSLSLASGVEGAGKSLDLNFTSTTALDGTFANITDLTSEGNVTLSGAISTSGSQTYNGSAALAGNTSLAGTSLSLASGVEGAGKSLDLNFTSTTALDGTFANITDLTSEGNVTLSGAISTSGSQTYNGSAALTGNTSLAGTSLSLASGVEGAGKSLDLNFTSTTALDGTFANITDLTSEGNVTLSGTISTSGSQTYNGSAALAGNTSLTGTTLSLASGVEGAGKSLDLNFTSTTALDGTFANITDLTSEGNVTLSGTISTSGSQTYNGSAALAGNTSLTGTTLSLASGVEGAGKSLDLNFSSTTALDGSFANISDLTSEGNVTLSGAISTSGSQTYNGSAALAGNTSLTGTTLSLASGVEGAGKSLDLNFASTTALDGNFVNITDLTSEGNVTLSGTILTSGSQTYNGSAALAGNTSLTGTSLSLASGVEGAGKSLDLNFASTTALDGTFTNITDLTSEGNVTLNGTIATSGSQTYNGSAALTGNASLTGATLSLASGVEGAGKSLDLNFTSTTALDGGFANITDLTSEGDVTLNGAITTSGSQSYQANATLIGDSTLTGASGIFAGSVIGGGNDLTLNFASSTALDGSFSGIANLTSLGNVSVNGTISTTGSQNYAAAATVAGDTTLTAAGNVTFAGTVDGGFILSSNATGMTTFGGVVGGTTPLQGVGVDNATTLSANVTTSGATLFSGPTTLAGDVTMNAGASLTQFIGGVDGNFALSVGPAGSAYGVFGSMGESVPLQSFAFDGFEAVFYGNITAVGAVTVDGLTVLEADSVVTSTDNGTVRFSGTVEGNGSESLVVNTGGSTVFGGQVSNVTSLATDAGGTTTLSGNVTTLGDQSYGDQVLLANAVTLAGVNGSLVTVDGGEGNSLTLNFSDTATVGAGGLVGNLGSFESLGQTVLNGTVQSSGPQTYAGITLAGATVISAGPVGGVLVQGKVDGGSALTVDTAAATVFQSAIGSTTPLASLTTDAAGSVTLTGDVTTTGNQTYGETLNLAAAVVLTGDVGSFPGVQANGNDLTLNFSSGISLQNLNGVRDLLVEGDASLEGLIAATGSQNYTANVTLTNAATIQANVASIAGTITGNNNDLTLNIATTVTIDGDATLANLANLTVLGAAELDASIQTSGVQNFAGPVTLLGSTDLTGLSGLFTGGIAGNAKALTLNYSQTTTVDGTSVFNNIGDFTVVGDANLNAAIQTTGLQSYGGVTTLLGDTALNTGGTGNVSFGSTVDGANRLDIEAGGGRVNFFAALGSTTPLRSLNLTSAFAVTALGTVAIDGTGAGSDGLLIGKNVSNVNIAQPGSTIDNANLAGIRFAGQSFNSRIGGFAITGSGGAGVEISPGIYNNTFIENNVLTAGGADGVYANGTIGSLTIEGNRIGGNAGSGVWMQNAFNFKGWFAVVANNTIGLDAAGNAAQPNAGQGIIFLGGRDGSAINNTIGGSGYFGIVVQDGASGISLTENRIGVAADFSTPVPNGQSGIFVLGGATGTVIAKNTIRGNSGMAGIQVVDGSTNTMIGGVTAGDANLIVGNGEFGITVSGDVTGTQVLRNLVSAHTTANIYLNNARGLAIGSTAGDGNTIDLADHGIIAGGDLTGTTVAGNSITDNAVTGVLLSSAQNATVDSNQINNNGPYGIFGTGDLAGSSIKSNTLSDQQVGVYVYEGSNLTIGSSDGTLVPATEGNTISNNSFAGVILDGGTDSNGSLTANVSVLSNSIYNNSQFGIALVNGANDGLTQPSLNSANTTLVTGSITGTDGDVFRIQYFKSSANVTTSSRTAQAEELIAYQDVTINGTQASIDLNIASAGVNATDWITVSKTLMDGSTPKATSELSYGVRVVE